MTIPPNTPPGDAPAAARWKAPRRLPREAVVRTDLSRGTLFLPCAAGVEPLLAAECERLLGRGPGPGIEAGRGGVYVDGSAGDAMRLNLGSRLAQRVLWQVVAGPYETEHDLYALARQVPWAEWITPRQTLRVDASAWRSPLQSLKFAALRIKDAVCDEMRERCGGERPSVDTRFPDLALVLHVGPTQATLSVDLSGEALFKRGWRDDKGEAPLKETLAAAMLAAAGWVSEDGLGLLDPCCGAGTIAIEAAQMACGMAPGLQRHFAFERLLPFRPLQAEWRRLMDEAKGAIHAPVAPVWAGDIAFRMTDFATRNAERAGVLHAIEFKAGDLLQRPAPAEAGVLMMNPPYGERIAPRGQGTRVRGADAVREQAGEAFEGATDAADFYGRLAAHWKRGYAGWTAWVLTPEPKLPSLMRLKESRRVPMWNGPIECRMFRFDLVAGSNRGDRSDRPDRSDRAAPDATDAPGA